MPDGDAAASRATGHDAFDKTIAKYEAENARYRQRHRDDTAKITALEAKVPTDGSVLLSKEDGEKWTAFLALKLSPDKIADTVTKVATLEAKVAATERRLVVEDAAKELGFKPTLLADLLQLKGLHVEMREKDVEGADGTTTKRKVPHVRPAADEKATAEPLATLIERDLADYLPALKAEGTTRSSSNGTGEAPTTRSTTTYPRQSGTRMPVPDVTTLVDTENEKIASGGYAL